MTFILRWSSLWASVSIHTPTKGVTSSSDGVRQRISVSIHTPTKGVTRSSFFDNIDIKSFNPHTHEGCDMDIDLIEPLWNGFNPHTHEGCDTAYIFGFVGRRKFQSTHPRRVWPFASVISIIQSFVSIHTPTKGVTNRCLVVVGADCVSIHTPTKGVTSRRKGTRILLGFQSTHPRRVWLIDYDKYGK